MSHTVALGFEVSDVSLTNRLPWESEKVSPVGPSISAEFTSTPPLANVWVAEL